MAELGYLRRMATDLDRMDTSRATSRRISSLWFAVLYPAVGALLGWLIGTDAVRWLPVLAAAVAAAPQLVTGSFLVRRNQKIPSPRPPVERVPALRSIGAEPQPRVLETSDHCSICGLPLTNPRSQLARVGMECIKTYGPRYKEVPNPAHAQWRAAMAHAETDYAAERAVARVGYQREMLKYSSDLDAWRSHCATPEVVASMQRRARGRRQQGVAIVGAATLFLSYLATAAAF
jgi:hypothetical protein